MRKATHSRAIVLLAVAIIGLAGAQAYAGGPPPTYNMIGGAVDAGANYITLGVIANITGDADYDGSATVQYRVQGSGTWKQGHPLYRLDATRFAGNIFYLTASTTYEVDVILSDPDGVSSDPAAFLITTKSETIPGEGTGTHRWVSPSGNDTWPGTQTQPYKTIGKAATVVNPGDYVHVMPGTYNEAVLLNRSGSSSAYITFKAEGSGVTLDSSNATYLDGTPDWTLDSGNTYVANSPTVTTYAAADGVRLYRRGTLSALKGNSGGVYGGFYYNSSKKKLYVSVPGPGGDPDNHTMNVATKAQGIKVMANYQVIDGFEIRYYGIDDYQAGIWVDGRDTPVGSYLVIRNNTIHNCGDGLWYRGYNPANNLISNNTFYDAGVTAWPWSMVKDTEMEESSVALEAGWNNVVRNNVCHGQFNGIGPSKWDALDDERYNGACDIYGNTIYDISDDCVEAEGACLNLAVFNNSLSNFHMGISASPITKGPAYYFRNVLWMWPAPPPFYNPGDASALKTGNSTAGRQYFYHNSYCTTAANQNGITPNGSFSNIIHKNNILYATWYAIEDLNNGGGGTSVFDYDDIYTTYWVPADPRYVKWANVRYATLGDWQSGTGQELHGLNANPLFTNMSTGDLTLQTGSPCINAGVVLPNINDGYLGAAPDLGALEKQ